MGWYSTAKFKGQRARNKVKKAAKPVGGFLSAVKTNIVIAGEQSGTLPRGKFRKIKVVKTVATETSLGIRGKTKWKLTNTFRRLMNEVLIT